MDANAQDLWFLLDLTLNFFENIKNAVRLTEWIGLFWVLTRAECLLGPCQGLTEDGVWGVGISTHEILKFNPSPAWQWNTNLQILFFFPFSKIPRETLQCGMMTALMVPGAGWRAFPRWHRCAVSWGSRVFPGRAMLRCWVDALRSRGPETMVVVQYSICIY